MRRWSDVVPRENSAHAIAIRQRLVEELKTFGIIALYLWVFLSAFTVYRRLILAESGITYLHYGVSLIEALIIAKVILIGSLFGFSKRFEDRPLIVPMLYKSLMFGVLILLFSVIEHLVDGWIHHKGLLGGLLEIREEGAYEIGARTVILVIALLPLAAFGEIGRVMGEHRLLQMFFSKRGAAASQH
jgi:hypothetical protein